MHVQRIRVIELGLGYLLCVYTNMHPVRQFGTGGQEECNFVVYVWSNDLVKKKLG